MRMLFSLLLLSLAAVACVTNGHDVTIESDYILPTQAIQFDADFR